MTGEKDSSGVVRTCCVRSFRNWRYPSAPCGNRAKIEREGKWYCGTHDPVRIRERQEERDKVERERRESRDAEYAYSKSVEAFGRAAIEAIQQIADGHNDPRSLAADLLSREPVSPGSGTG